MPVAALAGTVLTLGLDLAGIHGPWRLLALGMAGTGLIAFLIVLRLIHQQIHVAASAAVTATSAAQAAVQQVGAKSAEYAALQREIEEHRRLQRELTEAKQAAESATLAKGEFLATMSHEVRTPLNGIIPMLDLLQSSNLAPAQSEMLNPTLQSARQL